MGEGSGAFWGQMKAKIKEGKGGNKVMKQRRLEMSAKNDHQESVI